MGGEAGGGKTQEEESGGGETMIRIYGKINFPKKEYLKY